MIFLAGRTRTLAVALGLSVLALPLSPTQSQACTLDGKTGFIPENDLRIPVGTLDVSGIDEATFNAVIDRVERIYAPVVAKKGGVLQIQRLWNDSMVNASASRFRQYWSVKMYGGLARHKAITADGFAMVVCHELGHHLGGAPKKKSFFSDSWASNEGQADYFATLKCFREVFGSDENPRHPDLPAFVTEKCQRSFNLASEIRLCERTAMAAMSLGQFFADVSKSASPSFDTPDPTRVGKTRDGHPEAQCRLDTYFQGAICDADLSTEVNDKDPTIGTCSTEKGSEFGYRPLCWYKPKLSRL